MYDVSEILDALETAKNHIHNAADEVGYFIELEDAYHSILSCEHELEQLLDETNEILKKQQEAEEKALNREYEKSCL